MTSRRTRSRRRSAAVRKPLTPPLGVAEQRLAEALSQAVSRLQELARGWFRQEIDQADQRTDAFDVACTEAAGSFAGTNLTMVLGGPNRVASAALLALLAERVALGRPLMIRQDGVVEPFVFDAAQEIADDLCGLQMSALAERFERIDKDPETAAWMVGVHLAREGQNDPFAFPAWSDESMGESLLAAALMSAIMTMLRAEAEPGPEFEPHINGSIHVVQAAYSALSPDDRADFSSGFGSASQVVEECLLQSDLLDELDVADVHRLSAKVAGAFLLGLIGDSLDFDGEVAEQAQALLTYAHAVGMSVEVGQADDDPFATSSQAHAEPARKTPLLN